MAGRIPRKFIDDLLARTDIVEIIDGYVPLRRAGKNHLALCPFHEEKSPSFTVSQDKQFFHCFGCGANGTVITFLMEFNNVGFVEAVEQLAARAGIEVPREGGTETPGERHSTELYELMEMVVTFYRKQLREHQHAQRAVDYLKDRGLNGETAARFELGYAPPGWDTLIKALGQSDAARDRLSRAGMITRRDSGDYYDRFRDRIMFPIRDQRGRAIGFGGRVLDQGTPKYLNSPETPLFHKGRELYGLFQARKQNRHLEHIYVVEGYMDVLAMVQSGITAAAATLGTAATADHLELLFRSARRVIFCFDGDEAGRKAAWRALETSLPLLREGREVFFRFLPAADDPDTFLRREGREAFEDTSALTPLSQFLVNSIKDRGEHISREGQSRLMESLFPHVKRIPPGPYRTRMIEQVRSFHPDLADDLAAKLRGRRSTSGGQRQAGTARSSLLGSAIQYLLIRPELAKSVNNISDFKDLDAPGADFLQELMEFIQVRPHMTCAGILEHWRDTRYGARLENLAAAAAHLDPETMDLESEFQDALVRILGSKRKQRLQELTKVKRVSELSEEDRDRLRKLVTPVPGTNGKE